MWYLAVGVGGFIGGVVVAFLYGKWIKSRVADVATEVNDWAK